MTLRRGFTLVLAMFAAAFAGAQTVQEGQWIKLYDGETLFGWNMQGDSNWEIINGVVTVEKSDGSLLATTTHFKDFDLRAKVKITGNDTAGLEIRGSLEGHPSATGSAVILLEPKGGEQEIQVRVLGNEIEATIDGEAVEGLSISRATGHIGFQYHRTHGNRRHRPNVMEISQVELRPLQLTPIFNGENLDGWNIIPDRKSEFTVVDGALNIKDGNGQIETDGLYRDFLVQMDIISNGEHLNSGVFYRGPKGVFWLGYESQIRNQWMRDDRTRPVDYGTGGIYGVQESRNVVSSDFEWFNKTIVCHGNHMAVWLDGYQVSDFYDHRPINERGDAKNGFVPEAGTIHLQGHDPTTDLSFKNINIQDYDK